MSKEVENIISLINKGNLPPLNQNETFGIDTFKSNSSNERDIKKQICREIFEVLKDKLSDCRIIADGEYCGYYCEDVDNLLRQLHDKYEIYSDGYWRL